MPERGLGAVAVGIVVRIVEKRIDRPVAMQVYDPAGLSLANLVHPRLARRNDGVVDGLHRKYLSVSVTPRPFSGREMRQASDGPGAGTRRICRCTGLGAYLGLGSSGCWHVLRMTSTFISARIST